MPPLGRRTLLAHGPVAGVAALGGCLGEGRDGEDNSPSNGTEEPPEEQEYDAENPFTILLVNEGGQFETVDIEITRNGDGIFDDTLDVEPDERITVAEYETTGRYTIRAETDEHQMETAADIERENLMTHRAASGTIRVDEDGVLIRVFFDD